eukprot:TRINITY_DN2451_c0_g1_i1.p1 TRINITY_DN2451_c0_g1~~TRINITY_DN2451_c0_g1_i1.p1  ORF type:complete len:348 (-),score=94.26 TRINITY_DN2451_c0_g1_i1:52-1074(-)
MSDAMQKNIAIGVATVAVLGITFLLWRRLSSASPKTVFAVITANSQSGIGAIKALLSKADASKRTIRAIVRSADKVAEVKAKAGISEDAVSKGLVEFSVGADANKRSTVVDSLRGVEAAFIVTPTTEDRGILTQEMIHAAKEAGVKRIVLAVSWTVVCEEKLTEQDFGNSEKLARQLFPNRCCMLRAGYFMSNFLGAAGTIKNLGKIFLPLASNTKIAFVDPDDIGACAAAVLVTDTKAYKYPQRVVNVTGPEAFTMNEIAEIFGKHLGTDVKYVPVSLQQAQEGMRSAGRPEWEIAFVSCLIPYVDEGKIAKPDDEVKQLTGKHSTFRDWLRDNRQAFL